MRWIGVALAVSLGAAACSSDDRGDAGITTTDTEAVTQLDVASLAAFVEERRERSFDETMELQDADGSRVELFDDGLPVVDVVPASEFADLLDPEPLTANEWGLLRLLDIVDPDSERLTVNGQLNLAVSGYCCPILVARDDADDDVFESAVAVHELTHQLEIFDAVFPPGGDQNALEWRTYARAATEGNANRIRDEYLDSIDVTPERWDQIDPPPEGVPAKVDELFDFPYSSGADFMRAVADVGGESAIDAALAEPPVSAQQVMFPETYFAGDEPVHVDRPDPTAGPQLDRVGTLGTFLLYLTIRDADGETPAERIVSGWRGDSYVVSRSEERTCVDAEVLMTDATAATELADALTLASFEASTEDSVVGATRCLDT